MQISQSLWIFYPSLSRHRSEYPGFISPIPLQLSHSLSLHELDQLPIPVSFEVGRRTLDLHTLSTLQPGSLLDLDSALDGEVRILANQRCLGIGELVRLQDRLGVRVTRLFGHDEA